VTFTKPKTEDAIHNSSEWYTPTYILNAVKNLMGEISLDPSSCEAANTHVGARGFYGKELNGLELPWHGSVWCNPPYGKGFRLSDWTEKFIAEYTSKRIEQGCIIVPAYTAQRWFAPLWDVGLVCFLSKRVRFIRPDGTEGTSPMCAHAIVWAPMNRDWGVEETQRMSEVFAGLGSVVVKV
jgi:ParB family chromosome partitioning protein